LEAHNAIGCIATWYLEFKLISAVDTYKKASIEALMETISIRFDVFFELIQQTYNLILHWKFFYTNYL